VQQTLPEGSFILPADFARIEAALADLQKTSNAHATLTVQVNLHVHYEYPKHVTVGETTVVVNSKAEELKALAAGAPSEPPTPETPATPATPPTETPESAVVFSNPNLEPPSAQNPAIELPKAE
jgi:hypothetical protein